MIRVSRVLAVMAALALTATLVFAQSLRAGRTTSGIAYEWQGRGPVVVLITGSNLDRRMWTREAEWLDDSHTVIRYDLRAHGASDTATRPFSHVDDLFSLLDEVDVPTATLVGLSAGSTIALDAALRSPTRFDRLVLAGPSISGYVQRASPPFTSALVSALQQHDYRQAGEVLVHSSVFTVPAAQAALVRQMVMENDRLWSVPREFMRPNERPALHRLHEVGIPTLVVLGADDLLQRAEAELLAQDVKGSRLIVVPGGGHLVNLTSPEEFRVAVSEFFDATSQPSRVTPDDTR
jgi:pimeloyl-ACP methyl ester carboxylesterase